MVSKVKRPPIADNPKPAIRKKLEEFAHLFRGGPDEVRGDAKACYKVLHPKAGDKTAEVKGSLYLNHPIVQEILAAKAQEISEQADITQEYVLNIVRETMERCAQIRPVLDKQGNPVMVKTEDGEVKAAFTFDATNVFRGAELLGKNLKMWTDKVEANVNGVKACPTC
jgi:hypothetical protein